MKKGILLDIDYENKEKNSIIKLFIKVNKEKKEIKDYEFRPYFYVVPGINATELKKKLLKRFNREKGKGRIEKIELTKKEKIGNCLKLEFPSTNDLIIVRNELSEWIEVKEKREYSILYSKRYLIDKKLKPFNYIEFEEKNKKLIKLKKTNKKAKLNELNIMAFDLEIETDLKRMPVPKKNAIIMASIKSNEKEKVITTIKKAKGMKNVLVVNKEKELIHELSKELMNTDLILTYNGDDFDFPYLIERAKVLNTEFLIGKEKPRTKTLIMNKRVDVAGSPHIDVFKMIKFLAGIGAINLIKFDLENAYNKIFKKNKQKIDFNEIEKMLKGEKTRELVEYNLEDSIATFELGKKFIEMFIELSKLLNQRIQDTVRASTGNLVEQYLTIKSIENNYLIPNKPTEDKVRARMLHSFEGATVKEPVPGLHERIAELDFRSYHMSIVVSHNIGLDTLNCECCKGKAKEIKKGIWFCEKKKSFLASIVEELLELRSKEKQNLKGLKETSKEYANAFAKQFALKIIIASIYGYLGFPRSRWYSPKVMESIYYLVRKYIKESQEIAEKKGFKVLYSDTDGMYLLIPKEKTKEDIEKLRQLINSKMPGIMELEFEKMYKRGLFVTKRGIKEGAKKKYALIDYKGNLKIKGFELVRRDWSQIARDTQKKVIKAILEEGKPEKAIKIIKKIINELKEKKVKKKELIIRNVIQRKLENYAVINPALSAALKANKIKKRYKAGSLIEFIITKNGKTVSEKAMIAEEVKEGNYDADYYINNQVLPTVMKIIREFGYSKEDLMHGGKQQTLF